MCNFQNDLGVSSKCLTHVCFVPSTGCTGQPASPRLFLRYWRSSVWSWLPVAPDSVCAWHSEAVVTGKTKEATAVAKFGCALNHRWSWYATYATVYNHILIIIDFHHYITLCPTVSTCWWTWPRSIGSCDVQTFEANGLNATEGFQLSAGLPGLKNSKTEGETARSSWLPACGPITIPGEMKSNLTHVS